MRILSRLLVVVGLFSIAPLSGCFRVSADPGLPVGSACTDDSQCAGPGVPRCITGVYPLYDETSLPIEVRTFGEGLSAFPEPREAEST